MTEYDSFIFDKDVANAYREALDEINGLDADKLALGQIEIMIARVLLLLKAIQKQAERNRKRNRVSAGAANVAQAGIAQQHGAVQTQQTRQLNIQAEREVSKKRMRQL